MRFLLVLACSLLLAACAAPPSQTGPVMISGELTFRERIALPDAAEAVIALRAADSDAVLVEQRIALAGKQVPVRFSLPVERQRLGKAEGYTLQGRIMLADEPAWLSKPIALKLDDPQVDVGRLQLQRATGNGFTSTLQCGELTAAADFAEGARLQIAGKLLTLRQVEAASGVKYQAVEEPGTTLWLKGNEGRLERHGKTYPQCTLVTEGKLTGVEWVVEDVDGGGIIDDSRITMIFDEEGRLGGRASCNGYFAGYEAKGSTLSISHPGSTLMACAEALMNQEQRFLATLGAAKRYRFLPDGALVLETDDGRSLTARHD